MALKGAMTSTLAVTECNGRRNVKGLEAERRAVACDHAAMSAGPEVACIKVTAEPEGLFGARSCAVTAGRRDRAGGTCRRVVLFIKGCNR